MVKELPFNMLEESWKDLKPDQRKKLNDIQEWDLSFLLGEPLSRQGIKSEQDQINAVEELKKFLAIRIIFEPKHMGMFGPMVVSAWHAFILDTIKYEKFCMKFHGKLIHHVPGRKTGDDTSVWLGIYHSLFGKLPAIWKMDLNGIEIPTMESKMNIKLSCDYDHLDSDDGAYEK